MSFSWMSRLFQGRNADEGLAARHRPAGRPNRSAHKYSPTLLALEDRLVPTVSVFQTIPGASFDNTFDPATGADMNFGLPAEPSIAVGLTRMVEAVNNTVFVLDKTGGVIAQDNIFDAMIANGQLTFISNPSPVANITVSNLGEQVVYDDLSGHFYFFALQQQRIIATGVVTTNLYYAESLDSTPNDFTNGFFNFGNIPVNLPAQTAGAIGGTVPIDVRVGFNREAIFVTCDLVTQSNTVPASAYDSTFLLAINKQNFLAGFFQNNQFQLNNLNYGMAPAEMHNAPINSPEIFVGTNGIGNNNTPFGSASLRVTYMSNPLSATATFKTISVGVQAYGNGKLPDAPQGNDLLDTYDTAITNAAWRNNVLVAAQTAKVNGKDQVRWYQINTANNGAALAQQGNIDGGPGVWTYFPRIEISGRGDLGIVYTQSSTTQFPSTYVTGRNPVDPAGFLQTPVLIREGTTKYVDTNGPPYQPGRTSGIGVDPANPANFYSIGFYASSALNINNWSTQIANFSLSPAAASQIRLFSPLRFIYSPTTNTYIGNAVIVNTQNIVSGTFIVVFNIPDPSITMIAPGGVTNPITHQFLITFNGTFAPNQVLRFPIQYVTPLKIPVPTFYLSGFAGLI